VQQGYRVLVASTPERLARDEGDLWDSGKVSSDESVGIAYGGKPLASRQRCHWKVRLWDREGRAAAWSGAADWTMGLLAPGDWEAHWIEGASGGELSLEEREWVLGPKGAPELALRRLPMLRTAFVVEDRVRRADLAICGLGLYEARLNGEPLDDSVLEPGCTNFRKTCLYRVHDVRGQLRRGENVLGVLLGNGQYNVQGGRYVKYKGSFGPPKLIAQLDIEYADGRRARVITDGRWRSAPGPILFTCIYGGEDYDARHEAAGWDRPGFDAASWESARECEGQGGRLSCRSAPPLRVIERLPTLQVTQPRPGQWVYDLGQNHSGWPELAVKGPKGARVKLIPGELLNQDGTVSQASSGGPMGFSYTLKGEGVEVWHPRFSYYGYRYVQVEGAAPEQAADAPPGLPRVLSLTGQFIHSSVAPAGEIECSNPDIGRVHRLIRAAIRSNFQSVLTDCPHREKLGWLEVSHLLAGGITYNYDAATFYSKISDDMRASQLDNGLVPDIAPEYTVFSGGFRDSPEWGSAVAINPWTMWQTYGDRRILEENYDALKRYVAYLGTRAQDDIVAYGLGDWCDVGPGNPGESQLTSKGLTATAVWYQDIDVARQAAELLGHAEEARAFAALADRVKRAFNARFFDPATGQYDRGSQTAQAMPLALGLVEAGHREAVLARLVGDIRGRTNGVTAGDVGFVYLVRALTEAGKGDVLYDMVTQRGGPGYLYQLEKGATTLVETWDANPATSQNHCMLGHAEEWFYRGLGGIRSDPAGPGFARMIIRPQPVSGLEWAKVHYDSIRGRIAVAWKRESGRFALDVSVPGNTRATVFVPAPNAEAVTEGGKPAGEAEGVRLLRVEEGHAVYDVGSGDYAFCVEPSGG